MMTPTPLPLRIRTVKLVGLRCTLPRGTIYPQMLAIEIIGV